MDLQDKVVVVTGASSGIGEAIARDLSTAGAKLVLTARRADRLRALSSSLPGPSTHLAAAIEDAGTPQTLHDLALSEFGRADVLINNAGMFVAGSLETIDLDAGTDDPCQL
jgi:NADP-dependent 3-hydroxy acid dehydrogenase YdfG